MKKSKRPFKRWEKVIREDADWDFVFCWILEREKLKHMLKFWEDYWKDVVKGSSFCESYQDKTCSVITQLRTCIKLLTKIIDDSSHVWNCQSAGFHTEKIPGKELWELKSNDPESPGQCERIGYVNMRNAQRIIGTDRYLSIMRTKKNQDDKYGYPNYLSCQLENEVYLEKARHLYYKIRYEKEQSWWE